MHIWELHRDNEKLPNSLEIEAYMLFWAKKEVVGVWGSRGGEDNSQEDGKSKYLINKCFPCHAQRELWTNRPCRASSHLPHLTHTFCSYIWWQFSSWTRPSILIILYSRGEDKTLFLSFGPPSLQLRIIHMLNWHILGRFILNPFCPTFEISPISFIV